tara:strand:+ start:252 stop:1001 length:750 start_codon:yes stop_codon:yes gene_type:complete
MFKPTMYSDVEPMNTTDNINANPGVCAALAETLHLETLHQDLDTWLYGPLDLEGLSVDPFGDGWNVDGSDEESVVPLDDGEVSGEEMIGYGVEQEEAAAAGAPARKKQRSTGGKKQRSTGGKWTSEEDDILSRNAMQHSRFNVPWEHIVNTYLSNRTPQSARSRWAKLQKARQQDAAQTMMMIPDSPSSFEEATPEAEDDEITLDKKDYEGADLMMDITRSPCMTSPFIKQFKKVRIRLNMRKSERLAS